MCSKLTLFLAYQSEMIEPYLKYYKFLKIAIIFEDHDNFYICWKILAFAPPNPHTHVHTRHTHCMDIINLKLHMLYWVARKKSELYVCIPVMGTCTYVYIPVRVYIIAPKRSKIIRNKNVEIMYIYIYIYMCVHIDNGSMRLL